jgi:hypothetical protein
MVPGERNLFTLRPVLNSKNETQFANQIFPLKRFAETSKYGTHSTNKYNEYN